MSDWSTATPTRSLANSVCTELGCLCSAARSAWKPPQTPTQMGQTHGSGNAGRWRQHRCSDMDTQLADLTAAVQEQAVDALHQAANVRSGPCPNAAGRWLGIRVHWHICGGSTAAHDAGLHPGDCMAEYEVCDNACSRLCSRFAVLAWSMMPQQDGCQCRRGCEARTINALHSIDSLLSLVLTNAAIAKCHNACSNAHTTSNVEIVSLES